MIGCCDRIIKTIGVGGGGGGVISSNWRFILEGFLCMILTTSLRWGGFSEIVLRLLIFILCNRNSSGAMLPLSVSKSCRIELLGNYPVFDVVMVI